MRLDGAVVNPSHSGSEGLAAGRLQDERGAIVPAGCFGHIESPQNTPSRASIEHVGDHGTLIPGPRCEVCQEVARIGSGQTILVVAESAPDEDRFDAIVECEPVRELALHERARWQPLTNET